MSELPDSKNYFSPRWSPTGQYIAAVTKDSTKIVLFDTKSRTWSDLTQPTMGVIGYPSWSHDGQYIYFDTSFNEDPGFFRIRVADRKLEKLCSLKDVRRLSSNFGSWAGLAPDDSPLLIRDISSQEIYALDWQEP